jgi:hypothetical protein
MPLQVAAAARDVAGARQPLVVVKLATERDARRCRLVVLRRGESRET